MQPEGQLRIIQTVLGAGLGVGLRLARAQAEGGKRGKQGFGLLRINGILVWLHQQTHVVPFPVVGKENGSLPVRAGKGDLVNQVLGKRGLFDRQKPRRSGEQRVGQAGIAHIHAIITGPAEIGIAGGRNIAAQLQRHLRAVLIAHLRRGAGRVQPHIRQMLSHLGLVICHDAGHHQLGDGFQHGLFLIIAHGQPQTAALQREVPVLHAQGIAVALLLGDCDAVQLGGIAHIQSA